MSEEQPKEKYSFSSFNQILSSFSNDLKNVFPEKSRDIDEWFLALQSSSSTESGQHEIISSVLLPLRKYSKEIVCNDERMFNMPIMLSKKIDISAMWYNMKNMKPSQNDIQIFWNYLESIYTVGNIALKPQKEKQILIVINNIKQKYGNKLPVEADENDEPEDGGFNTEAITKATEQLQQMFGGNPVLNNLVKDIAENVGEKLKGKNQMMLMGKLLSGDHSMFGDLLNNMSAKYGEQLKETPIDEQEIHQKTQQLFGGFQNMFPGGFPGGFPFPGPQTGETGETGETGGFPNNDDIITDPNILAESQSQIQSATEQAVKSSHNNHMLAMQTQIEQMMSQLPPEMRTQLQSQLPQLPAQPQLQSQSQSQPTQKQVKSVRSKQKVPTTPEENLKFALNAGFSKYDYERFEEALGDSNSVVHEHWWPGMKADFLNKKVWNEQAQHAIMMMCRDGLGPALETILGNHPEWIKLMSERE